MKQHPSPLLACNPCRQLSSSSSSGDMSDGDRRQDMLTCHQIFREADGVAPMERSIDEAHAPCRPTAFGVMSSSVPHHQASRLSESEGPSPFFAISRANPITSYDSSSNGAASDLGATYSEYCDDEDMNDRTYHDIIEQQASTNQDDVLRRYNNTSTPSSGTTVDFSPFFRANPAPVTPHASETVVLSTEQSVLSNQIQPNFFNSAPSSSANMSSNATPLLLGEGEDGRRSFSPSGVTEIQNQRGGRDDGAAAKAPTTPTISNGNSYVEDDTNFSSSGQQQQQRSPFRSRQHQDEGPQHDQRHRLQYLQHPLIHTSWTSTTDGSSIVSSHQGSGIDRSTSSLLCSSTSAESCSFDAPNM